jgi:hypothetical protein
MSVQQGNTISLMKLPNENVRVIVLIPEITLASSFVGVLESTGDVDQFFVYKIYCYIFTNFVVSTRINIVHNMVKVYLQPYNGPESQIIWPQGKISIEQLKLLFPGIVHYFLL